ncbi:MAG: putative ABC transporter ATP-binding protein YheS [Candidatus Celerinatantimonas neptuna]|nr:MAG: putative ABC transporter ATP-binding protein YheS [Candidatus Celerinatantimonas neptuna]
MSTYLSAQSLSLAFSSVSLFDSVSFTLNQGDRVGLIGHNGCGKSSLLKLLSGHIDSFTGQVSIARQCAVAYVEQQLPDSLQNVTLVEALSATVKEDEIWRSELLLSQLGFLPRYWQMPVSYLSGGQHMRLLLGRAIINQPDLLLLDEPSNHLDLTALLWLESFLSQWSGSFILVSHDQSLLDKVTNTTWIMRDRRLYHFNMTCSAARQALLAQDEAQKQRYDSEQKEIDRLEQSAKRLANWGKVYDNEDLARKAKTMQARRQRLVENQTQLGEGVPWRLIFHGESLPADRLVAIEHMNVSPEASRLSLFQILQKQVKSGERVAIMGDNGCGKSTLLKNLYQFYQHQDEHTVRYHPQCRMGYYDQSLQQLLDSETLHDALIRFAPVNDDIRKRALIRAGFDYQRHRQKVGSLSGGERARLLFIGLSLARYHLLMLDEPTNHLDLAGKEELIATLSNYPGGVLLVSHDRQLIEACCQRFWLVHHGALTEYMDIEKVYDQLKQDEASCGYVSQADALTPVGPLQHEEEEDLLARLVELEQLLKDDLKRKPKHQKLARQAQWRLGIEKINRQL